MPNGVVRGKGVEGIAASEDTYFLMLQAFVWDERMTGSCSHHQVIIDRPYPRYNCKDRPNRMRQGGLTTNKGGQKRRSIVQRLGCETAVLDPQGKVADLCVFAIFLS